METVDSKIEPLAHKSNLVVSIIFKIEIILAVVWFFESSVDLAIVIGTACAFINQFTEIHYCKATAPRKKLQILLLSLLVIWGLYLAATLIHVDFTYHRQGQTGVDTYKIWLAAKVLCFLFVFLVAERLFAVGADYLIKRIEQNRKLKDTS